MNQEEALREKAWYEFATLPPEAQQQVVDFIAFLRSRYGKAPSGDEACQPADLAEEPFVGLWQNRPDMNDSRKWLRSLREQEWSESSE